MKANRETVSEFQQFDAVMHKVLSDSRQVQMVEVYHKDDFKKTDRSKAGARHENTGWRFDKV
jgi:enamine deaminase RidA (YjgF/YER057c/UK114 family)